MERKENKINNLGDLGSSLGGYDDIPVDRNGRWGDVPLSKFQVPSPSILTIFFMGAFHR